MIFNHAVNVGGFIYCTTHYGPHTVGTYFNSNDGHYHQAIYIVEGQAMCEVRDAADIDTSPFIREGNITPGQLFDNSNSKGKYVTTITEEQGITLVMFNPIPHTRELDIEIVKGTTTRTIIVTDKRITVVCILGPITVNDKTVESLQHVKVFPGKTVTISLPEHTVCALVQDK